MDPTSLASGSQDGIMKFFDLRSFEIMAQFSSNAGSVRDLQFNPNAFYQVGVFEIRFLKKFNLENNASVVLLYVYFPTNLFA
jgi:WD40 repeat protein